MRTHILGTRHCQGVWSVGQTEELSFPSVGAGSVLPLQKGGLVSLRPELAADEHRGYFLLNVEEIYFVFLQILPRLVSSSEDKMQMKCFCSKYPDNEDI